MEENLVVPKLGEFNINDYDIYPGLSEISIKIVKEKLQAVAKDNVPYYWTFMRCLADYEVKVNPDLALDLIKFASLYYSNFKWSGANRASYLDVVTSTAFLHHNDFVKVYGTGIPESRFIEQSKMFGRICTEFAIRYLSYTYVNHEDKMVVTPLHEEDLKEFVEKGYRIESLPSVSPVDLKDVIPNVNLTWEREGLLDELPKVREEDLYEQIKLK